MSYDEFMMVHPELADASQDWKNQCCDDYVQSLNDAINSLEEESY